MKKFLSFLAFILILNNAYGQKLLMEYEKKGFSIVGPIQVEKVNSDCVFLYQFKKICRTEKTKLTIIDKDGKCAKIRENDWVYVLKKGKEVVLIKIQKRKRKND